MAADVWSVTSYKELYRDAVDTERWNLLHPAETPRVPYLRRATGDDAGPVVAASDYTKALPHSIARWLAGPLTALGTDGFGRSENRASLRNFFEVDARYIAVAALGALAEKGELEPAAVAGAIVKLGLDPDKANPLAV